MRHRLLCVSNINLKWNWLPHSRVNQGYLLRWDSHLCHGSEYLTAVSSPTGSVLLALLALFAVLLITAANKQECPWGGYCSTMVTVNFSTSSSFAMRIFAFLFFDIINWLRFDVGDSGDNHGWTLWVSTGLPRFSGQNISYIKFGINCWNTSETFFHAWVNLAQLTTAYP